MTTLAALANAAGISEADARARLRALRDAAVRERAADSTIDRTPKVWTKPAAIEALRAFYGVEGRAPKLDELRPPRLPSERTMRRLFAGGLKVALRAAGLTGGYEVEIEQPTLFEVEA